MIVLGIDPGVSETGWAVLKDGALVGHGCIKTSPDTAFADRLNQIHAAVSAVISEFVPDAVAIEEMFFAKVANTIRMTLQARGVIVLAAGQAGKPVHEYNPKTVKLTLTGSGSADKPTMQRAIMRSLGMSEPLRPDDVADAAAIALCHQRMGRVAKFKVLDRFGGKK
jgi:crossover junction endodeoxyribonuclease RuvC